MLSILVATQRLGDLHPFSEALSSDPDVRLQHVASGTDALNAVRGASPDLVIIDHDLPDFQPLDLVSRLLMVNAMVNSAVVSVMSDVEFHEATEGLGILGRLPVKPGSADAVELLGKLRRVLEQPA